MKTLTAMLFIVCALSARSFGAEKLRDSGSLTIDVGSYCYPRWTYEPKKDITTYELAIIVPFLVSFQSWHEPDRPNIEFALKDLGTAARHFTKSECKK